MISMLLLIMIFAGITVFVIQPLFLNVIPDLSESESSLPALKQRKKIVYRQIKELDMDYKIGKMNHEDFQEERRALKREAASIIQQIKQQA